MVEVLTTSGCGRCQKVKTLARDVIAKLGDHRVHYREINVVEEIDYAVALGVLSTPAIALNGQLVFTSAPSTANLRKAIEQRLFDRPRYSAGARRHQYRLARKLAIGRALAAWF